MPRTTRFSTGVALTAALVGVATTAADATAASAAPKKKATESGLTAPKVAFQQYTLPNGLRVILSPDMAKDAPPVVAVNITYDVGSRNERPGRSGFAHLFEHMMFQGSENVGKGEQFYLVGENGGTMNGTTNLDRTNYFEALPANQLELGLFLEADRLRSLDVSQENLDNQRAVVQEEKRQSYDNRPYGHVFETILDLSYNSFPYKHTTIGSMEDLNAATLEDVRQFFHTYYTPSNAVLTVAGRFDPGDARALIAKYYAPIASKPVPPAVTFDEPTTFPGERRKTLQDPLARQTQYVASYRVPPSSDPDNYALNLLGDILSYGKTSRLYQALVESEKAVSVSGGPLEQRGPALFTISADLPAKGDIAAVEAAIDAEIARIAKDGVTPDEVATAYAQERVGWIRGLQSAMGRANLLGQLAVYYHEPDRINTFLPKLEAVTPADIQRVAQKYFVPANRIVVITEPATTGDAKGGA